MPVTQGKSDTMTDIYTLPELPYALDALEPWCSAETLTLHHGTHHKAYVDGANAAVHAMEALDPADAFRLAGVRAALAFNVGGHVLHSLFWTSICADSADPSPSMMSKIESDFGSFDRFKKLLVGHCMGVQGSGWGALMIGSLDQRLTIGAIHEHQNDHSPNANVVAVIDVWEHAYYLDHRSVRADWVKAVVEHLDWSSIEKRSSIS